MNSRGAYADDEYAYRMPTGKRRFRITFYCAIAILALWFLALGVGRGDIGLVGLAVLLPACLGVIVLLELRNVRRVRFLPGARVEFHRPGRTLVVPAGDLLSLKASDSGQAVAILLYRGGKLIIMMQMTGWHELVGRLKQLNPFMETRGV